MSEQIGQPPSPGAAMDLALQVLGQENGLQTLLRDLKAKVRVAAQDVENASKEIERAKKKLTVAQTTHRNWEQFHGILDALADRWGVKDYASLPTQERTQENNGDPGVTPVQVNPETKARIEEGKLCMYRDQKTKKWCPTKLTKKRKEQGHEYCAKHHKVVYGEDG